jgi:hypothetical protein
MLNELFAESVDYVAHYECRCEFAYRHRWRQKPWFGNYTLECPRCGVENEPRYLFDAARILEFPAGPDLLENCEFDDQLTSIEEIERELYGENEAPDPSPPADNVADNQGDSSPEW